jgi:hypothetical protein
MATESIVGILAWLAGAFFCGLLPLGIAAILFFTSRKRGQIGSTVGTIKRTTIAALQPATEPFRLEGRLDPAGNGFDGPLETAVVYLRLKAERYERDEDSSGWRGLTDKTRAVPFKLQDGSGAVWVNPEGLDKQLLGNPITPTDDQVQAACILLGINPKILRGQLRYTLWEFRGGQTLTVVGNVFQDPAGLVVRRLQGKPFIISPLLGEALGTTLSTQQNKAHIWMYVLGIPGALFLLCGLGGALYSLARLLGVF